MGVIMGNKVVIKNYYLDSQNISKKIKIVLISDIHISSILKEKRLENIIQKVKEIKPNYICIPGDLIDSVNVLEDEKNKKMTISFLKRLGLITKVIISLGNHDISRLLSKSFHTKWNDDKDNVFFNELKKIKNVKLLDNDIYCDGDIRFIGFTPSFKYYRKRDGDIDVLIKEMSDVVLKVDNNKYNILLCHSPVHILNDEILEKVTFMKDINLILSGHMHNGMVHPIMEIFWKGNNGIITPGRRFFSKILSRGMIKKDDITLIISGGITKLSYSAPNLLHHLNCLYPMNMEIINVRNNG